MYVTDATPPLSVVLVVALIEPPAAAQFTVWSAIPFPNASTSFTLSVNVEPMTAAGLSDPNFRSSAGGPATSTILKLVRIDPTAADHGGGERRRPGRVGRLRHPVGVGRGEVSLSVPPPIPMVHETDVPAIGVSPPPVTRTTNGCDIFTPAAVVWLSGLTATIALGLDGSVPPSLPQPAWVATSTANARGARRTGRTNSEFTHPLRGAQVGPG